MSEFQKGLIAVLLVAVPALCVVLVTPFYIDNYIFQSIATDYSRFGKIPYITSWDHNFPGIIYFHYIAILLFGPKEIGFRIFDVLIQLGFVVMFYRLLLKWLRPWTAALAVVMYILYYVGNGQELYGQREVYMAMLIFASFFLLLKGKPRIVPAGLVAGLTVLMKPTAFFDLGLLWLYVLLNGNLRFAKGAISRPIFFIAAGILPIAIVLIYYYTIPGGLEAFYDSTIRFNLDVYSKFHVPFTHFVKVLLQYGVLLGFAFYSLLGLSSKSTEGFRASFDGVRPRLPLLWSDPFKKDKLFLLAFIVSSIAFVLLQRKYIPYHFAPFFMTVIPLSAIGIERFTSRIRFSALRYFVVIVSMLACSVHLLFLWKYPVVFVESFFQNEHSGTPIDHALRATYEADYSSPDWGVKPEQGVINYLSRPENNAGAVEVFDFVPLLRSHLDRVFAGPYIMPTPIALRADGGIGAVPHYTDYQQRWRAAYMDTLRSVNPRFLIMDRNTMYWYLHDPYNSWLRYMPGFDSFLDTRYRYDTSFGWYQIYRRR